jgi:putative ABC transport system permease protein
MLPLLRIRDISPLATLRRDVDPGGPRWDTLRALAVVGIVLSVVALAAVQIGSLKQGSWFAAGTAGALLVLWLAALALTVIARRWTPASLPYLWRQGLANLHRPANQTVTVVIALGFGAFLLTTLFTAQSNLLRTLRFESGGMQENLVLFDIQPDQRQLVDSALRLGQITPGSYTPIVPMRMLIVKGDSITTLLRRAAAAGDSDTVEAVRGDAPRKSAGAPPWTLRREYRSTYRGEKMAGELITAGKWFTATAQGSGKRADDPVAISMEDGLAAQIGLKVGDPVVWDVQGATVYSRITSLRKLNWARFEPNFFVVFAPGAIDQAPQSSVTMVRAPDATARGQVQRFLAEHAANVTSIDLGEIAKSLQALVDRIVLAIRFMALFSLATGAVVLIGAIATSRWQRVREGTLLRTLGATRAQVLLILCVEYAALGLGAAIVASGLAGAAGWAIAKWYFDARFALPIVPVLVLALGLVTLTTLVGLLNSLEVLKRPPLEVLRAE